MQSAGERVERSEERKTSHPRHRSQAQRVPRNGDKGRRPQSHQPHGLVQGGAGSVAPDRTHASVVRAQAAPTRP